MKEITDKLLAGIDNGEKAFCGPAQLHIDLTNLCNVRCLSCWHRSPLIPREEVLPHWAPRHSLPYEKVREIIDEVAELEVKRIIYSGGGDPLLYPHVFEVLQATKGKGIEMMLVSNLTMANRGTMERVVKVGVDRLLVSIWAGDEETYDRMHPGIERGTFKRVVSLLQALKQIRAPEESPQLIIMNVVCNRNVHDVEAMVSLAVALGAGEVWFQPIDVENDHLRPLLMSREEINSLIDTLERCTVKYRPLLKPWQQNLLCFDEFLEKLRNSRAAEGLFHSDVIETIPCYMGWAECRILANGDVVPCCKADKMPLGNILNRRFREVWFSAPYREFRRKAKILPKTDPYFRNIFCYKVCDDWWLNKQVHRQYVQHAKKAAGGDSG